MSPASEIKKALPSDEFAERAILGAMLINNKYANEVFSEIHSEDFYRNSHQKIAAAIDFLINKGEAADIVTIAGYLDKKGELKYAGGFEYINSLIDGIPESLNIAEYVKSVKDRSVLRQIVKTSMGIAKKGVEEAVDSESILEELQGDILKISGNSTKGGFHPATEVVPDTMARIESIQKEGDGGGIPTGFYELDDMTAGFHSGELIVLAARPSMGKTAMGLNIASNMAVKSKVSVGFFSIEMTRAQIMMRLLALRAEVNMKSLMTGKPRFNQQEWRQLELAAGEFEKSKIYIDDSPTLSVVEMKTRARRLKNEKGLDIIFVDYLQLMKVTGDSGRKVDSRSQEVAIISSSLKELAKELEIPVVALAQLNRSPEQRGGGKDGGGPKYQLSDLKESGAIEQDADLIMFLHREEQVNKETERLGEADLIIAKQRNGPTGKILMAYLSKYTKFANLDRGDKEYL